MGKYKSPIGMFIVVTPRGFPISYSRRDSATESIATVVKMLDKDWAQLEQDGYRCAVIGKPQKVSVK